MPDLRFAHCEKCLLEWKAPDPLGGVCTGCRGEASEGRLSGHTPGQHQVTQRALAAALSQWSRRPALRERHAVLVERLAELRAAAERRAAAVRLRRRQLEMRRDELRERRRRHETLASGWAAAWRSLEAKRCRISCDEFLRDPAKHSLTLGAFHVYQELSVVRSALQGERRRRIAELVEIVPLKWIVREDGGDRTVSLGQVQSFVVPGVLQEDELKDLEAALSFLLPLVAMLAVYLDVALPFQCTGARGLEEACSEASCEHIEERPRAVSESSASISLPRPRRPSKDASVARVQAAWWARPCVWHPFTSRWSNFSIYDGICTSEFSMALRLLDEDLLKLCASQGEVPSADFGTLQLLASCLSAAQLGCVSPPLALQDGCIASVSQADTSSLAGSSTMLNASITQVYDSILLPKSPPRRSRRPELSAESAAGGALACETQDGEWTVVE